MKHPSSKAASALALAAFLLPAFAKDAQPIPSAANQGSDEPCGNPDYSETPYCRSCESGWNWFIPAKGSTCDTNSIRAYNGNAHREITDLTIAGSAGGNPLSFKRYSNTRLSTRNLAHSAFGSESSWSHNYEWVMRDNGGTAAQPIIKLTYPNGKEGRFQREGAASSTWIPLPVVSRNPDRIYSSGDDFLLRTGDLNEYGFKRRIHSVSGGVFYRIESLRDPHANATTISYQDNDDSLIRQVTDPSGRWIKLHYNDLSVQSNASTTLATELLPTGSTGVWKEITLTPGETFRFLALYQGNGWRQKTPLRVAELEFYDQNNVKITGTTFGSWPWATNSEPYKATDGNLNTRYEYAYEKAGYVGIDLGAGNAKQVSRIRYRLNGPLNSDASVTFVGMNNEPVPNPVVSHIEGSDGRQVGYDYAVYTEPSGVFQWAQLKAANYPDLTASSYKYKWQHRHVMPVLETANDPRYAENVRHVRYGYNLDTVVGFVVDEYDHTTGQLVASVRWDGGHIPKLAYPNGKVNRFEYNDGNLMRAVDSFGGSTDYTYNARGFLLTEEDPIGRTTTYTRRWADGRMLSVKRPDNSLTTYTLDTIGHITAANENGRTTTHILDPVTKLRTRTNHPDGTYQTWTYNTYGQPLTHRQRNGFSESWTYDTTGLKKTHTDAAGAVTTYHHYGDPSIPATYGPGFFGGTANAAGRLAYIVDAHGNTTKYTYNDRGQILKEIRSPGGNITLGGLTVQDTSNDFIVTTDNTYDDYGNLIARVINTTDPAISGRMWIYDYDSLSRIIREVDPLGRETFTSYDLGTGGCGPCGGSSPKPVQITHPDGSITRNTYDVEWRLLSTTQAFGTADAATTSYTYDLAGQRLTMTDPLGHITRWTYDPAGRVLSETRAHGTPIASTTTSAYDIHGNTTSTTDPVGTVTAMSYDNMDRAVSVTAAQGTAAAATSTRSYESTTGRLQKTKDPLNRETLYQYDALDRVTKATRPDGNFTENFYDLLGRNYRNRDLLGNLPSRVFTSSGQTLASTSSAGITTTTVYNGLGDTVAASLPSGKTVAYIHDIAGNTIKTILAPGTAEQTIASEILTRDAMLRPITVKDGEGSVTTYSYDTLGRTLSTTDQLGHKSEYTYDLEGQLLTVREADNILPSTAPPNSTRTYDALHRLKTEKDGKNQLTTYNYDAAGRMTSYVNAKNATFAFQYDPLGRQTRRTEPDFTFQTYTYDVLGRLLTHTKADGKTKTHHYDNPLRDDLNRITYSSGEPQRTFGYTAIGQLASAANASATITMGYDTAGRRTSETQALQGLPGTHTFAYFYDGDGNLDHHTRPDGSTVDYDYNLRNLLEAVTADAAPPVAEYTYNGRNQLSTTEVENGLFTATRGYDTAGRLTGVSNGALDTTAYTLSPDGRRTAITRSGGGLHPPSQETYTYDAARQVESASIPLTGGTRTNGYQYDAAGNRSTATTSGGGLHPPSQTYFSNLLNEYTSINGFNPTHDANGNLLTGQVRPLGSPSLVSCVFSWDINNQMTAATNATGDTATYEYDALGRRTKRTETISGTPLSTWFLTNGWNVELEYENGAYVRRLTWGQDLGGSLQGAGGVGGLVMAEDLPPGGAAPVTSFPTYDGNGNITAWINSSGTVTARQRYDAFGNIIEQTGTAPSRYGFSTKPMDLVSGFLYYGYRYYDPVTGRWPSRDPIEEEGGMNLYGFVWNDGVNQWDYLGNGPNPAIWLPGDREPGGYPFSNFSRRDENEGCLKYSSEGFAYFDGFIYYSGSESSGKSESSKAYYRQYAEEIYCPGGLCNSKVNVVRDGSYIRAFVTNNGNREREVTCSCKLNYVSMTWATILSGTNTLVGEILDETIIKRTTGKINKIRDSTGKLLLVSTFLSGEISKTTTFTLKAGQTKQLYRAQISLAQSINPGAGFYGSLEGDCSCY